MTTETTALTVTQRAAVALGSSKAETELTALALQSKSITVITNLDGRTECHSAAMTAKEARIVIEKAGKAARDDSNAFSRAVIAEERRLVGLISPEEDRLITLRDAWDEKIAADKAAKAEAERIALDAIMKRIDTIRSWPLSVTEATSESVLDEIEHLEAMEIDDSFKDYYGEAVEAKSASLQKLREIYAAKSRAEAEALRIKQEREAEDARLKSEREELDRQRAEQNRIDEQRRAEREEEDRKAKVQRDDQERQLQAQRDELARQQKIIDDQKAEQERIRKEAEAKAAQSETNTPPSVSSAPAPESAPASVRQPVMTSATLPACDSYRPVIQPNAEMIEPIFAQPVELVDDLITEIFADMKRMTPGEIKQMAHMRDRIFAMRQPVAA